MAKSREGHPKAIDRRAPRYLAVGHLTRDLVDDSSTKGLTGGTVFFAARTAAALGWQTAIATSTRAVVEGDEALHIVDAFDHGSPCKASTSETVFLNTYDSVGARRQILRGRAAPVRASDIPERWHEVDVLHVAPVLDEVDALTVANVHASFVGLTPQGFMRHARIGEVVSPQEPRVPEALLERADGIVVSAEDIAAAPGWPSLLTRPGRWVALTHGPRGAELLIDGRRLHQPAFASDSLDPTGAGDIFAAALFTEMARGAEPTAALRFAAAAGAWSVRFRASDSRVTPTREDIEGMIARGRG